MLALDNDSVQNREFRMQCYWHDQSRKASYGLCAIQTAFLVKPCSNLEHVHRNTWKILTRKAASFGKAQFPCRSMAVISCTKLGTHRYKSFNINCQKSFNDIELVNYYIGFLLSGYKTAYHLTCLDDMCSEGWPIDVYDCCYRSFTRRI